MRKVFGVVVLSLMVGCAKNSQQTNIRTTSPVMVATPEDAVKMFYAAMNAKDGSAAWALLCDRAREQSSKQPKTRADAKELGVSMRELKALSEEEYFSKLVSASSAGERYFIFGETTTIIEGDGSSSRVVYSDRSGKFCEAYTCKTSEGWRFDEVRCYNDVQ